MRSTTQDLGTSLLVMTVLEAGYVQYASNVCNAPCSNVPFPTVKLASSCGYT